MELLTTAGRDANNQMFSIAWADVDLDNTNNWEWFLERLKEDLKMDDGKTWYNKERLLSLSLYCVCIYLYFIYTFL